MRTTRSVPGLRESDRVGYRPPEGRRPPLEVTFNVVKGALVPPLKLWFNWRFEGLENVPPDGPALIAGNHISYVDPLAHAYFVVRSGRRPRFLGKEELFEVPLVGWVLRDAGQIPVQRGTGDQTPLRMAEEALENGEVVVIYPEGTVTTNPDSTPMRAKTGVARLALATGVPITPVATWGGQQVWQKTGRGSLKFARPIWVKAGVPIEVSDGVEERNDFGVVRRLTDRVTEELSVLVEDLRARYPKRWT